MIFDDTLTNDYHLIYKKEDDDYCLLDGSLSLHWVYIL